MTEKRLLALLALLLGLLAAVLILVSALNLGRRDSYDLAFVASRIVDLVLAVAVLLGSVLIYRGQYRTGGIVNLVLGIVLVVIHFLDAGGILAILSGLLGLVAAESRR